jgi:hypothetical protein
MENVLQIVDMDIILLLLEISLNALNAIPVVITVHIKMNVMNVSMVTLKLKTNVYLNVLLDILELEMNVKNVGQMTV